MNLIRLVKIVFLGSVLSACAAQPVMMPTAEFSPVQPIPAKAPVQPTGSIFANGRDLFGDLRSYQAADIQVGDLITVLLNETTQASRTSGLSTSRETENDVIGPDQLNSIVDNLGFGATFMTNAETDGSAISSEGTRHCWTDGFIDRVHFSHGCRSTGQWQSNHCRRETAGTDRRYRVYSG